MKCFLGLVKICLLEIFLWLFSLVPIRSGMFLFRFIPSTPLCIQPGRRSAPWAQDESRYLLFSSYVAELEIVNWNGLVSSSISASRTARTVWWDVTVPDIISASYSPCVFGSPYFDVGEVENSEAYNDNYRNTWRRWFLKVVLEAISRKT